jgi:hypothetical protein
MAVTLDMLRARLDVPDTVVADEEMQEILDACTVQQVQRVGMSAYGPHLDRALVRRVGREIAARGLPLGLANTEFGSTFIPAWDPILQQLEAGDLLGGFA